MVERVQVIGNISIKYNQSMMGNLSTSFVVSSQMLGFSRMRVSPNREATYCCITASIKMVSMYLRQNKERKCENYRAR